MKLSKNYLYFIFARILGLLVKPLFLMYLLKNGMDDNAATLSQVFLLFGGVFVLYHVPVHFEYYKSNFEYNKSFLSIREEFNIYVTNIVHHVILFFPLVFVLSSLVVDTLYFSILISIYLIIEKIFDEIQRYLLFSKEFKKWSNNFLFKTVIPFILTLMYIQFEYSYPIVFFLIITIISLLLIIKKNIPYFILKYIYNKVLLTMTIKKLHQYIYILKNKYFSKFILGISTSNVLNIDKWLASLLYTKTLLAELTLASQISNGISVAMNYATISNRRTELIKEENTLSSLLLGWKVPLISLVLFSMVIVLISSVDTITESIKELNFNMILFIVLSYSIYAITQPLSEYLFWNYKIKVLLFVDAIYFIIMITSGIILYIYDSYTYIPVFFLIGHLFRCMAQLLLVYKSGNKYV